MSEDMKKETLSRKENERERAEEEKLRREERQKGAEEKITDENIPIEMAHLTVEAPVEKVKEILSKSEEFKDKVDALLGYGLN